MEIEQKRSFIIRVIYFLIWAVISVLVLKYGIPMVAPFAVAFIIVYALHRPICYLSSKLRLPYKPTALVMVLLFYCTVGTLIGWLVLRAGSGLRSLVEQLPGLYTTKLEPALIDWFAWAEQMIYETDTTLFSMIQGFDSQFIQWLGSLVSSLSGKAVGLASNVAMSIPGLFIKLVLMIISTFFMAVDYDLLTGFCLRQLSEGSRTLFLQIKDYVVGTLFVCIGSYAIIMSLTFLELSIGLSILKIPYAILVAALIALFDILPVLGTGGIMIPWAVIAMLQGNLSRGIGLVIVYVVVTVIRNVVEPKIVGRQLGLHPIVTLASMFVGAQLFGAVGLFGFPIGLSLLRYLNDNGSIHIFKTE